MRNIIQIHDKKQCSGCEACLNCCPVDAITMQEDNEGFLYPIVNMQKCINCVICEKVCPYLNDCAEGSEKELSLCYAGYNANDKMRMQSSSGGIFALAAEYVLSQKGIVYGAAFDDVFSVYHTSTEDIKELPKLMGSKYTQSRIGYVYQEIKQNLLADRRVLFTGTTCQVAGLKAYLGHKYMNLICIDFICLGIPSPKVWRDYLKTYFEDFKIQNINFKDKTNGWHNFTLRISGKNNEYLKLGRQTEFFVGYFKGLYSRPSCSQCKFKADERASDITIADCWGYNNIAPEIDDNRGLSSIVVHSLIGVSLFDEIKSGLIYKEALLADVKKYNENYHIAKPMGAKREQFWQDYDRVPMGKNFKKYCKVKKDKRLGVMIKRILRRLIL